MDDQETNAGRGEAAVDGLDVLRAQVERRARSVPAPRRPKPPPSEDVGGAAPEHAPPTQTSESGPVALSGASPGTPDEPKAVKARARQRAPQSRTGVAVASSTDDRPKTQPDEPLANLAVRVRRSLDARLGDLIYELRRDGVRTSKVELVELLLWELPAEPSADLRRRLADFRQHAPREEPL